jgi:hypothetical protein
VSIAIATTSITVQRGDDLSDVDPWERNPTDPGRQDIATGVPADIGINTGRSGGPGDTQTLEFILACDPTDLTFRDTVIDERTGASYQVQWATLNPGLPGLEHITAGLVQVTGYGNA